MLSSRSNFLVCFFLLVFIGSTVGYVASPSLSKLHHHDVPNGNHPSSSAMDFGEGIKYISTEVEHFFSNFTNNGDFILRNLNSIVSNILEEGFVNVATWMLDLVVRVEFLIMADGSHYVFPLDTDANLEEEHRIIAISVSKILMNLKTMERTDKLIKNVSRSLLTSEDLKAQFTELKSSPLKLLKKLLQMYFEALNHQFETDDQLGVEYRNGKVQAKEVVKRDPKMREPLLKVWVRPMEPISMDELIQFLKNKDVYLQACVNKFFLKQAEKHLTMIFSPTHHKRYLLSRALISVARASNHHESEINEIYHRALTLASAAENIQASDSVVSDALFDSIEKNLESVPTLQSEVRTVMEEVKKNTVYNIDMLHIDFSLV